jgi:hypothetical protein
MRGQCARLALILHLARDPAGRSAVDVAAVEGAVRLCEYFKATAALVHGRLLAGTNTRQERDARAVREWAKKAACVAGRNPPSFKWAEVRRDLHNRFENRDDDLRKVLAVLEGRGYLREVEQHRQGATGRNPKPAYLVNPLWLHGDAGEDSAKSVETA